MELNKDQIEHLFQFVEQKGVKYYDVQHEIVDHLASSIESEMSTDNKVSFELSLNNVYSKYPITGFAQYTLDLEKSLRTFWIRKVLSMVATGYGVPLIVFILGVTLSIFLSVSSFGSVAAQTWYYGILIFGVIALITFGKQFGKSSVEMMLYFEFFIAKDDLTKRLLYYNVLKIIILFVVLVPLYIFHFSEIILYDSSTKIFEAKSTEIAIFSILGSISLYISAIITLKFPTLLKEIILSKYNHVVIA